MKKAFTLIELLVVATIIVILTVMVVVSLGKAQMKSRDVQRKADLSKIAAALEMYKAEKKAYPTLINFAAITATIIPANYLAQIPVDPVNTGNYKYQYAGNVGSISGFKVKALSETIKDATDAQRKAGDFYDSVNPTFFQISSNITALAW